MHRHHHYLPALLLAACAAGAFAQAPQHELRLDAVSAFAIGTEVNIESVREVSADSLNALLALRQQGVEGSAGIPAILALELVGAGMAGHRQAVETVWGPVDEASTLFRVTIEDSGFEDDSIGGERWVLWLERQAAGGLTVRRGLWAQRCQRVHWAFYSAKPCP